MGAAMGVDRIIRDLRKHRHAMRECVSDDSVLEQEFGERFNKFALLAQRTSIKELLLKDTFL